MKCARCGKETDRLYSVAVYMDVSEAGSDTQLHTESETEHNLCDCCVCDLTDYHVPGCSKDKIDGVIFGIDGLKEYQGEFKANVDMPDFLKDIIGLGKKKGDN